MFLFFFLYLILPVVLLLFSFMHLQSKSKAFPAYDFSGEWPTAKQVKFVVETTGYHAAAAVVAVVPSRNSGVDAPGQFVGSLCLCSVAPRSSR